MTLLPGDPRHGTYNGYNNHGCRCAACTRANADYQWLSGKGQAYSRRKGHKPLAVYLAEIAAQHGTESKYSAGCRCDLCRDAARDARARRRARQGAPGAA